MSRGSQNKQKGVGKTKGAEEKRGPEPWDVFVPDSKLPHDVRHVNPKPSIGPPLRDLKAEAHITRILVLLTAQQATNSVIHDLSGTYSRWLLREITISNSRGIELLYVYCGKQRRGIFTWTFAHLMSEMKRLKIWTRVIVSNVQNRVFATHLCSDRYKHRSPVIARQSISFNIV